MKEAREGQSSILKAPANYVKEKYDLIDVEHGLNNEGDYIWHFSNHHRSRTLPQDLTYYVRVIKTFLDPVIPEDITVNVFLPPLDWEIKVITVRAYGIGKKWSFSEEDMKKNLPEICTMMSDELNRIHKKRK